MSNVECGQGEYWLFIAEGRKEDKKEGTWRLFPCRKQVETSYFSLLFFSSRLFLESTSLVDAARLPRFIMEPTERQSRAWMSNI
jgi:hypothetical protein